MTTQTKDSSGAGSTVLVVEDDDSFGTVLAALLTQDGFRPTRVTSAEAALESIESAPFDLVLTDLKLPAMDGLNLLRQLKLKVPEVPVVLITGHGSVPLAVEAIREGAADFLEKSADRHEVLRVVTRALVMTRAVRNSPPPVSVEPESGAGGLLGTSQALQTAREHIRILALSDSNVLIRGETGTGKELAARAIHALSPRAKKPFVRVNCAGFPDDLFDSEMFGSAKGTHSTAYATKPGRVELAEGGTLFLDEVGDLSRDHQVKLLTFLQDKGYERLGTGRTVKANVRVVAASNQPLEKMIASGTFREDFFHRFGLDLFLPPLREFRDDIVLLAKHFVSMLGPANRRPNATLSPTACALLRAHDWPGNVRELQGFLERLILFSPGDRLDDTDVRREFQRRAGRPAPIASVTAPDSLKERVSATESAAVAEALLKTGGNKTQAARVLGISRRSLYDRLGEAKSPRETGRPGKSDLRTPPEDD